MGILRPFKVTSFFTFSQCSVIIEVTPPAGQAGIKSVLITGELRYSFEPSGCTDANREIGVTGPGL